MNNQTNKQPSYLGPFLLAVSVIIILLACLIKTCNSVGKPDIPSVYKTDTVYKDSLVVFQPLEGGAIPDQPKTLIIYKKIPQTTNELHYDSMANRLAIISIKGDTLGFYPGNWLTTYVQAPKILHQRISQTQLSMDLYYPNGFIYTPVYDLDLKRNSYDWQPYTLSHKPLRVKEPFFSVGGYLFSLYSPLHHKFTMGTEYDLIHKNISLTGRLSGSLNPIPQVDLEIGGKVKIQ